MTSKMSANNQEMINGGNDEEEDREEDSSSDSDPDEFNSDVDVDDDSDYIDECEVNISHFDLKVTLGTGAYGTVLLGQKNCGIDKGQCYAIKVINKELVVKVEKTITHMRAERKSLEIFRDCPFIQRLYYAFQSADKLYLVTEYLPGGELFTQVQKGKLPETTVLFYLAELVIALERIHKEGVIYRDIKLENILLDKYGHVKLVDFGLCKKLAEHGRSKSCCGTEEYMAPEVVRGTGHNAAADWWALGVLAIELLSTATPFGITEQDAQEEIAISDKVLHAEPQLPEKISDEMIDLLLKLLDKDPKRRLGGIESSVTEVKRHPLFRGIDWDKLAKRQMPIPEVPTLNNEFDTQNFDAQFTSLPPIIQPTAVPENTFKLFKGYSYIAPELLQTQENDYPHSETQESDQAHSETQESDHTDSERHGNADSAIDENQNSLTREIVGDRDPESEFFQRYRFVSFETLGIGRSSVCMKCFNLSDKEEYAVKIYKRNEENANEVEFLRKAAEENLPFIPRLCEVLTDSKWTYLIMELVDGIDLLEFFQTSQSKETVVSAFTHLLNIIKKVHSLQYDHGCICFKNIRYLPNKQFCLLGFSSVRPTTQGRDTRIDYWSVGVCIYTVLCGHSPFDLLNGDVTLMTHRIENGEFDQDSDQWKSLHKDTQTFIRNLLYKVMIPKKAVSELKKSIKQPIPDSVMWSEALVAENTSIVQARAAYEIRMSAIKAEVTTNGDVNTEESQSARSTRARRPNAKYQSSPKEPGRKRTKRDSSATAVMVRESKRPKRETTAMTNGSAQQIEPAQQNGRIENKPKIKSEEESKPRRGRPRKEPNAATTATNFNAPPTNVLSTINQGSVPATNSLQSNYCRHSANCSCFSRTRVPERPNYCFIRVDYVKG